MAWPSLAEYNAAFARPERGILGASLKGAVPKFGPLGTPMPISGGLAYIYEMVIPDGRRLAVRCFKNEDDQRTKGTAEACSILQSALASTPSLRPHFIRAQWVEDCVATTARTVPAIVMDWAEGKVLSAWLEARHRDGAALRQLREELSALAAVLEKRSIVHGDLQTRNIFVGERGLPVLIDYDELRFIGRSTVPAFEAGHMHFQHPGWSSSCDPAKKDRFPLISMDLGLAALATDPGLFDRFATGENVLFIRDDYLDPASSPAFAALRRLEGFSRAAELFAGLCRADAGIVPSLAEFRKEAWAAATAFTSEFLPAGEECRAEIVAVRVRPASYVGPYPVYAGNDFAGILRAVGKSVEIVGRIRSVKDDGVTKHGDPYTFVNFADWRGNGFKLTIWSEGLDSFSLPPSRSWEGRWVSATGLVDEPYVSARWKNTQLSITIRDSSQIRFIDETEARYRLGKSSPGMEYMAAVQPSSTSANRPSNAALLAALAASKAAQQTTIRQTSIGRSPGSASRSPRSAVPPTKRSGMSIGGKLAVAAIVILVLYFLIRMTSG
jgi:hypothetical protein